MAARSSSYVAVDSCVCMSGTVIPIPSFPQYLPCPCTDSCDILACNCVLQHGCAYDENGKLKECYLKRDCITNPIIECSHFCSCEESCFNRVTQKGMSKSLHVSDAGCKGYGVFTSQCLLKGTFLCEYIGELVTKDEYEARLSRDPDAVCYSVKVVEHIGRDNGNLLTTCIDASHYGNISRFMNHSCSPNVVLLPVRSDSVVPRICLFTAEAVNKGQELCFSYCDIVCDAVSLGNVQCCCESSDCMGFLPLQNQF